jgi:hypothetical protein
LNKFCFYSSCEEISFPKDQIKFAQHTIITKTERKERKEEREKERKKEGNEESDKNTEVLIHYYI